MDALLHSRGYAVLQLRMDASSRLHFLIPGLIALGVAIADEFYQSFLPNRDASPIDVFLDFIGITFALLLIFRLYKRQKNE